MSTTNTARLDQTDSLASLEERVIRAVQLVSELREERDALRKQLEGAENRISELKAQNADLAEAVEGLQSERKQVRGRIEKLLGQMDLLSAT